MDNPVLNNNFTPARAIKKEGARYGVNLKLRNDSCLSNYRPGFIGRPGAPEPRIHIRRVAFPALPVAPGAVLRGAHRIT